MERFKDVAEGEGDLTKRIPITSEDEIGELAKWFNLFLDKIHDMDAKIRGRCGSTAGQRQ